MTWWLADRGQTPAGKASGSGRQVRLTRHFFEEGNASEDATEVKAQNEQDQSDIDPCLTNDIDGHAKPDQHGRGRCDFGRSSAHPPGRQAFLRTRGFAHEMLWNGMPSIADIRAIGRANSGLMHRNKIRPIRHPVAAAEHRMRYARIDRDRGFESRRQACRCLVERRFLGGEAEPSRAVSARLTVIARRTVTCCHTTNAGSC